VTAAVEDGASMRFAPFLLLAALAAPASGDTHVVESATSILNLVIPRIEEVCEARFETRPAVREVSDLVARRIAAEDVRPELERQYPGVTEGQMRFLTQMHSTSLARSCLARYSLSRKEIVLVRETFDTQREALGIDEADAWPLLASTLAHECVHALDDARFDLAKLYRSAPDEEALRARVMVVEGRGLAFGRRVATMLDLPERVRELLPGGREPDDYRAWGIRLTSEYGLRFVETILTRGGVELVDRFVETLLAKGGPELVDRAMLEPPATTHLVCQPGIWPDGKEDPAPRRLLERLGLGETAAVLSELQLRTRYAAADGLETADRLFADYRGGAQALVGKTNVAALAFGSEDAAARYAERSRREAQVLHDGGVVVLRVAGEGAKEVAGDLRARLER
jgi:hypothetical protein